MESETKTLQGYITRVRKNLFEGIVWNPETELEEDVEVPLALVLERDQDLIDEEVEFTLTFKDGMIDKVRFPAYIDPEEEIFPSFDGGWDDDED